VIFESHAVFAFCTTTAQAQQFQLAQFPFNSAV